MSSCALVLLRYFPHTYYITKWIQEFIIAVPVSLLFCGLVYIALGMKGQFGTFWIAYFLTQVQRRPLFSTQFLST